MHANLLLVLGLLFSVFLLVMLAQRIKIAYPIFLVIAGLGVSLIPGIPHITVDPELIFLIFLPPLLYEAAWYTSWRDFWKWKRPIALLAFGLVFFTSTMVAFASVHIIPGFTLALGFLLGGIISPPDAVAAATVLKGIKVPKRILTILEGESLVNDASSLIVFRFALAAVMTGVFSFEQASGQFFVVAGMGIVVGIAGAHVMYAIHRFLPTTPAIDAALTVMTPYILFLAAEEFHFSGVMAVVSGGLFISYRSHEIFSNGMTRLNMLGVWNTMIFVMNALVFILIGLSLPEIISGLGENSVIDGIIYGTIISVIAITLRFLWVYPATHIPRLLSKKITKNEPSPGWKGPLIVSWAGMRGVVSLATALSIPVLMQDGNHFPFRNLIIFITFVVIFITLVIQGLTLPLIVKWIGIGEIDDLLPGDEEQAGIKMRMAKVAMNVLQRNYTEALENNELLGLLKKDIENDILSTTKRLASLECEIEEDEIELYKKAVAEIYKKQRHELFLLRKEKIFSDTEIRKAEMQLDLDETKMGGSLH